jgi:hypothetical protein
VIAKSEIAWAAGLFDGEGSASTYLPKERLTRRRQMQVSQGGRPGVLPAVLVRFRDAADGRGGITGPYRGYLYYWKTTRNDDIDAITIALWPYLSAEKRVQLTAAARDVRRTTPTLREGRLSPDDERAWAAGLFDGEGCLSLTRERASGWRGVSLYLSQSALDSAPDTILRFHRAIHGLGTLTGPHRPRSPWSRLPQYHWQTSGRHSVSRVLRVLWPWLGIVSRRRALSAGRYLDPDFESGRPIAE